MWLWCTCCARGTASSPHMWVKCAQQTGHSTPRGCTLCGRTRCTAPRTLCGTTHTERGAPVTHMPPPSGLRVTLFGIREIAGKGKNLPFYWEPFTNVQGSRPTSTWSYTVRSQQHSHSTDKFLQFPAMTRVLNFTLAFYASLLNPLFTRAAWS